MSNATSPPKLLTPEQHTELRRAALVRFVESCEFDDWASSQCAVPMLQDMNRTRLQKRGYSCP